ncbi:SDR family oxidoreductase [Candidatus Bipolaricaulota bacterium]|nr:SDR family oxidoreductase [Candidatus Bipolaricaulota bacterium]
MMKNSPAVVLITGASSGIGRACAIHLARQGYHVFGTTRRVPGQVETDLRQSLALSDQLNVVTLDVDDNESVVGAIEAILDKTGRLDAVVNCAGFGIAGAVEETSDQEARAIFETNLLGILRVCRAAIPTMRTQGSGIIINISSIGGRIGLPFQGFYSATKFALEGLTEALRMEIRGFGIRAVLIEPGDFCTGFTDSRHLVEKSGLSNVYRDSQEHVLSIVEKDERGGASPDSIARLVARILTKRSPRVRYTVGPAAQKLAAALKKVLPSKWFEWALSKYYGVK